MVMRSIYLILGCCLMFAAVMVTGLSMQSCKSKRSMEKSVQVDSVSMTAYKEETDSFAFRRLLERNNKHWTLEVLHYRPVFDSTGKVAQTYLEKRIQMQHQHEKERDGTGFDATFNTIEDSIESSVSEETDENEEPAPAKGNKIFFYLVLAYLLYLWMKK